MASAFPGQHGRKLFILAFNINGSDIRFDLKAKGFGIFGTGLPYYAPISVLGLFRYLAHKRSSDPIYLGQLASAASMAGNAWLGKHVHVSNQNGLCRSILDAVTAQVPASAVASGSNEDVDKPSTSPVIEAPASDDTLPDTIVVDSPKYTELGSEFASRMQSHDGTNVARTLHAWFEQDLQEWFYERVFRYFDDVPTSQWSQQASMTAEFECRNAISFYQSVRCAFVAREFGYVPPEHFAWFIDWLLKLNLGENGATDAKQHWLKAFLADTSEGQAGLFTAALSKMLPEKKGRFFVISLFVHALDGRIRATTARAFHDKLVATQQASEAIKIEANAWNSLQRYTSGGGHLFALENEKGIFTMQVRGHRVLPVWLELQEVNPERFGERHSVSRIDFRELQNLLRRMKAANISFVATSTEKDAERLVPIDQLLNHVNQTVTSVDDSEMGKMFRDGIECDQP